MQFLNKCFHPFSSAFDNLWYEDGQFQFFLEKLYALLTVIERKYE